MDALEYYPETRIPMDENHTDFDELQQKALEVLDERQDDDASLLLYNSGNNGGCRPKAIFEDNEGHWI